MRHEKYYSQETLTLCFRSCFLNFGTYGLALVNQIFDSDSCLAGVPLRMTLQTTNPRFQNDEWTRSNYEFIRPSYEKVLDCSRSHISALRIRISRLRTEIFKLRTPLKNFFCFGIV